MHRLLMLLAVVVLALTAFSACGGDDGDTLVIAIQPSATQSELSDQASELEAFLEERLDVDVELRFPTSYAGVIESLRFGHADAAFMSAWPAALAGKHADAEVVLAEVREVRIGEELREEPYYYSYWVVNKDSDVDSLDDLRDKDIALPSQLSTSGYVAPMAHLVELGLLQREGDGSVTPDDFFGAVLFAGGYSQAWEALKAGQVEASVIAGDVPADLYNEVLENTRIIDEQGPIPSHAVVFSKDLQGEMREDLKQALLELGEDPYRELMRKFVSGIFVRFMESTNEEHLGGLNQYLEQTGLAFIERLQ